MEFDLKIKTHLNRLEKFEYEIYDYLGKPKNREVNFWFYDSYTSLKKKGIKYNINF